LHLAHQTVEKIEDLGWKLLQHLSYSPDLAPNNFYLFGPQSNYLETLSSRMMKIFYSIMSRNFYRCQQKLSAMGFSRLVEQWEHCSELQGLYVKKEHNCQNCAIYCHCIKDVVLEFIERLS